MHVTYCDPSEDRRVERGWKWLGELASLHSSTSSNSYHLVSAPPTQYIEQPPGGLPSGPAAGVGGASLLDGVNQFVKFKISGIGREANISVTERFLKSPAISLF